MSEPKKPRCRSWLAIRRYLAGDPPRGAVVGRIHCDGQHPPTEQHRHVWDHGATYWSGGRDR